jgi:hypothetical protein
MEKHDPKGVKREPLRNGRKGSTKMDHGPALPTSDQKPTPPPSPYDYCDLKD